MPSGVISDMNIRFRHRWASPSRTATLPSSCSSFSVDRGIAPPTGDPAGLIEQHGRLLAGNAHDPHEHEPGFEHEIDREAAWGRGRTHCEYRVAGGNVKKKEKKR